MSNLFIVLSIVAGLVLAALVAYNAWTLRRNAPRKAVPDFSEESSKPVEPTLDEETTQPAIHLPGVPKRLALDSLIDVIAPLELESDDEVVSGEAALLAMPSTRRVGTKQFAVEGCNILTGEWESPTPGQRYSSFQAGVQMANRTGALNEIEFSEFVVKTTAFADAIGATPAFPEMLDEVARAKELDAFASSQDAQLNFSIRARNAAWSPGYILQTAARFGFIPGVLPGRLVLPASTEGAPAVLVLSFDSQAALAEDPEQTAVRELALNLDVAQVERSERAYVRMREIAAALAKIMEGIITDDNAQVLVPDAMDAIGAELEKLYDTLASRDFAAGSPLARRLFS